MPTEQIIVYAFINNKGDESQFVTMDSSVALDYSVTNDMEVIARIYEYKQSVRPQDVDLNLLGDDYGTR